MVCKTTTSTYFESYFESNNQQNVKQILLSNYRFYELYKVSGGSRSELDRDFFNGNSGDGDSLRTVQLLPEQREV